MFTFTGVILAALYTTVLILGIIGAVLVTSPNDKQKRRTGIIISIIAGVICVTASILAALANAGL